MVCFDVLFLLFFLSRLIALGLSPSCVDILALVVHHGWRVEIFESVQHLSLVLFVHEFHSMFVLVPLLVRLFDGCGIVGLCGMAVLGHMTRV